MRSTSWGILLRNHRCRDRSEHRSVGLDQSEEERGSSSHVRCQTYLRFLR